MQYEHGLASAGGERSVPAPDPPIADLLDLTSSAFFHDPYPTYAHLRDAGPIHRVGLFGGAWIVTRHREAAGLLRDRRLSVQRSDALFASFEDRDRAALAPFHHLFSQWMIFLEGRKHRALRQALAESFSTHEIEALRPRIAATAQALITEAIQKGPLDLVRDLAEPLPAVVIAELLGVPPADRPRLVGWSSRIARFFGAARGNLGVAYAAQEALIELVDYFAIGLRGNHIHGGVMGKALNRVSDDDFEPEAVYAQCAMLLFAGHETTKNLIGNGLHLLLTHGEERERLRRAPALFRGAVHEVLRFESPVQLGSRVVTETLRIGDETLANGDIVLLLLGCANRDERAFAEPDRFDIARSPNRHLAFGYGPRMCLGVHLACLEAELAVNEVLGRFPSLRAANPAPDWLPSFGFRGPSSLPVEI